VRTKKRLFILPFFLAAIVIFAAAAAAETPCSYKDENTQENKAVCNEKIVVEISDTQEFGTCEKPDNAAQHQQGAENPGSPSEIVNNCRKFHSDWFW